MSIDSEALTIVEAALDIGDAAARAVFVANATADPAVRARVEQLLAQDVTDFRLLSTESFTQPLAVVDRIPDQIGPYRVVAEIARGGMGAVVRAERDDGLFEQTVAIKLIRADLASDRTRRRFADERRMLARLRHPNIVRIVDGGDIDGRPWLAMDFVEGAPVDAALRDAALPARLDAFTHVCEAVAHAHRNLIVHADIKPSNVLMDAAGQVHLLDFGIARLLVDLDPAEAGDPYPLTKGYAAPERGIGVAPTIASDVFSLGVLLLAMLDKETPRDGMAFRPGTRLPADALDGDLGAIAAEALADDPADRYPDVPALLDDVRRFRALKPVAAGRGGRRHVVALYIRRNLRPLAIVAMVALGLMAATVISVVSYAHAERSRIEADRRFDELRGLARFMLTELTDRLSDAPGTVPARARIAAVAGRYLDRLRAVPDAPADLRLDTARGYRRLATLQGLSGTSSLGQPAAAARSLDQAAALLTTLRRDRPDDTDVIEEQGWVDAGRWTLMGDTPGSAARNAATAALFASALAINPDRQTALLGWLTTEKNRAYDLIWGADRPGDAIAPLRAALARLRATRWAPGLRRDASLLEVNLLGRLGDALYYAGDKPGSLVPYREGEAIVRRWLARGSSMVWIDRLGDAKFNISGTLQEMPGRQSDAEREAAEGVAVVRAALAFGPDANLEKRLLILLGQRATVLADMGRVGEAVTVSAESVTLRRARLARNPSDPQRNRDLAVGLSPHAAFLAKAGRRAEACRIARDAVAQWEGIRRAGQLGARDAAKDLPNARRDAAAYCS